MQAICLTCRNNHLVRPEAVSFNQLFSQYFLFFIHIDKILIFSVLEQNQTLTQQMRHKGNKIMEFKAWKADKNFTEELLTGYTGLTVVSKYIQAQGSRKGSFGQIAPIFFFRVILLFLCN